MRCKSKLTTFVKLSPNSKSHKFTVTGRTPYEMVQLQYRIRAMMKKGMKISEIRKGVE